MEQPTPRTSTSGKDDSKRRLTRRRFMRRLFGGVLAAAGGATYARYVEPFWPSVECVEMDLPRLGKPLEGLKLLQLSDLHLSPRTSVDYLHQQLLRCSDFSPDLIVITGDFITFGGSGWLGRLTKLMEIPRAPLGVYAVLGNHDCGAYDRGGITPRSISPARSASVSNALMAAGIVVLRNEKHVVERGGAKLQLVGLDDLWSGSYSPGQAFADVATELPCVALSHNPDTINELKDLPCDWVLCGHTHGGQVRIPFYGPPILPVENRQYDAGLFNVSGTQLYVNRGLGFLRQVRFNCRPEITLFTLTRRA